MANGVIIQASSRSNGNTAIVVKMIQKFTDFDIIDLNRYNIGHFNYDFENENDDFNNLFKSIANNYQTIVFATPVYWYTMSGILKVFLDRISDFLYKEKEYGRLLRGKRLALISCNSDKEYFEGFEIPIVKSANYLGMQFISYEHTWVLEEGISKEIEHRCKSFADKVMESKS